MADDVRGLGNADTHATARASGFFRRNIEIRVFARSLFGNLALFRIGPDVLVFDCIVLVFGAGAELGLIQRPPWVYRPRRIRRTSRQIGVFALGQSDGRQGRSGIALIGDAECINDAGSVTQQRTKRVHGFVVRRALHRPAQRIARQYKIRLRSTDRQGGRIGCREQSHQVIRHAPGNRRIHAQVFAQVEQQLETQHILAKRGKQRAPGDALLGVHGRVFAPDFLEQRLDVAPFIRIKRQVACRMEQREDGFFAARQGNRQVQRGTIGFNKGAAFVRRPIAVQQVKRLAKPGKQDQLQQALVFRGAKTRQVFQQHRHAFFGFELEERLAAQPPGLQNVRALPRPRQHRVDTQQVAHADRAAQIGAQRQAALAEQGLARQHQFFHAAHAMFTGHIGHRAAEIRHARIQMAAAPVQPQRRPARFALGTQ